MPMSQAEHRADAVLALGHIEDQIAELQRQADSLRNEIRTWNAES